jgi:hypothetical protein
MVAPQGVDLDLLSTGRVPEHDGDSGGILGDPGSEQGFEDAGLLGCDRGGAEDAGENEEKARVSHCRKLFQFRIQRIRQT